MIIAFRCYENFRLSSCNEIAESSVFDRTADFQLNMD
jgi:hypothetical protein